jgi:sugar phosphate isomerase/epimerase
MLSREELILSTGTVGNPSLTTLLEAAGAGAYTGLAIWPADYTRWRAEGTSDAEAHRRIADQGLTVAQLDCLLMWTAKPDRAAPEETEVFQAAGAFGADCVSCIGPGTDRYSVPELAEKLAGVCDRGRELGFDIALEVAPWKGNVDLAAAAQIMEETGRDNARLVIDSWHVFRGGTPLEQLARLPGRFVASIQISDGPRRGAADLVAETMGHRLLPGEGELDLAGFVKALDVQVDGVPMTVEVLSDALRLAGPMEAARRTAEATRQLLTAIDQD